MADDFGGGAELLAGPLGVALFVERICTGGDEDNQDSKVEDEFHLDSIIY